ncbi:Outer membrane protein TolC [Bacteroides luti]|uniref:Outer membrane protein TolC n=1 Tax=Bacteroides luti TaxID=1297750 RepID=A0A1M5H758_9BACE|nr:TolC family protein [Bacteroides luti]SHG11542.1 Outer membrane protein TolC [Bacteroides luti]
MSKKIVLITAFIVSLCVQQLYAQDSFCYTLGIDEMFRLADENSKSIRTFDTGIEQAKEGVKVAKNNMLPSIDAGLSFSYLGNGYITDRNFSNGLKAAIPHYGNNFSIDASQVVYAGGAISGGIAIAELQQQIAELDKVNNQQDVRFLLIGYYMELYKLANYAKVYTKNIEQTQKLLKDIRAKQKEGTALRNDITRYELQLKNLELQLTKVMNNRLIINHQLITVLGLPKSATIVPDTTILQKELTISGVEDWQRMASSSLPSLRKMELGIDVSKQQETIIKSEKLPHIALVAANHLDGPVTIDIPAINKNFNYWYVGVGVKYNLASLYKTNKQYKQAKLATRRAQEQLALAKDMTENEIQAAYTYYLESFTELNTQEKSLELATQNYDVVNNRYLNDLALITDMLDASNSKLSAELQVANARINILYNYYKLKKVSGNL